VPKPILPGRRYIAGLDGLRAIAVVAVVLYHLGFDWAPGGLLGVAVFFTLSGYLITDILLAGLGRNGRFGLREFWLHRARRLLPALLALLIAVTAYVTVAHRSQLVDLRGAVLAALTYVSNWWLIGQNLSYFDRFGPPSPLGHLWSLAVEDQFYLIWPWLLLLGVKVFDRRCASGEPRKTLATVTLLLALASAIEMAVLYRPALDMTRVYDGTDTRAFGLLIGAALAMSWPSARPRPRRRALMFSDLLGLLGLAGIASMVWQVDEYSAVLYRGGLVALSLCAAAIIAAVVRPGSWLGALLGSPPLRWVGARSYGIYLWHYPIVVLTSPDGISTPSPIRSSLQVAGTLIAAMLSWRFVEQPVRDGALGRLWARRRSWGWFSGLSAWRVGGISMLVVVFATACVGMTTVNPNGLASAARSAAGPTVTVSLPAPPSSSPALTSTAPATTEPVPASSSVSAPAPVVVASAAATTTSCTSVVHIGDSTSEGMVSPDYLPNPAQRIDAQYARVGVTSRNLQVVGGTSVLETAAAGEQNAAAIAQQLKAHGYHGCWVLALGTNDTADVYVGSVLDRPGRVARMMSIIGNQPVLWVDVKSLRTGGPYSNQNMQLWNQALTQSCSKYPNMRVDDWASVVQDSWFGSDAIHFTSTGYAYRGAQIADALVHAFPAGAPAAGGCLVQ
jgi:peptidoglycan/LPS O-acetylase OafA/YrhL/lysophospholipase L1-like esterase